MQSHLQQPLANRLGNAPDGLSGETRETFLVKAEAMFNDIYGYGGNAVTNAAAVQFGGSVVPGTLAAFLKSGRLLSIIGNPVAGNGADTTDDILGGFVLPAGAFDVAGRGLDLTFAGKFAANGNNKQIKVWLNPTMAGQTVTAGIISGGTVSGVGTGASLLASGVLTSNAVGWEVMVALRKFGAAASNTQYAQATSIFGTTATIVAPTFPTQTESAAMSIVVTGSSSTTGAALDVLLNFLEVFAKN